MKFFKRLVYVSLAGLFALASCAKEESVPYEKFENIALKAWIEKYRPELKDNIQVDGGYYVDVIEAGDQSAAPVNDTICWVKYDFTGRNLNGDIILTRSEAEAKLAGTFTKYTHYVPYYRYCGEYTNMPVEGTHLAMRNVLTLGEQYFLDNKGFLGITKPEILLREGSVVDLYLPSRVVRGLEGQGGYEGQYTLSDKKPLIVRMTVRDTVKNPLGKEGLAVDAFVKQDGGLQIFDKDKNKRPEKLDDPKHPYNDTADAWANVCDSVPQLYANFRFKPNETLKFPEGTVYKSGYAPYSAFSKLEKDISDALVKKFHTDKAYVGVKALADTVGTTGTAKIWYIGRLLDGFIFDTNIGEVKDLIYGVKGAKGTALTYKLADKDNIQAFYYTVANLRYGQWAVMITTSTNGYGANGRAGSTTTSGGSSGYSSGYSDYMGLYNGYNSMYGGMGGYGGYYNDYYSGYNNGYYSNYGSNYGNIGTGTTTTTVNTEIPPFTPLIFELYIEPKEED